MLTKSWWRAAGIRVLRTFAQTAVSLILLAPVTGLLDVGWLGVLSGAGLAGVLSLLQSLAGLPEVEVTNQPK